MRVIIVEDNPDHQLIIKKKLEGYYQDIEIDTAINYDEATEFFNKSVYDTVLLDYRLKGSSGIDLVQWIHEQGIDTPVIMITSVEDVEIAVKAIKLGVYDYICKNAESFDKLPLLLEKVMHEYTLKKKLKEAEFKYRTLVEGMNEAVFLVKKNGDILFVSSSVERLFGYTEEEFRRDFLSYLSVEDKQKFLSNLEQVMAGETVEPFVISLNTKEGRKIFIEINESRFLSDGGVNEVIGTIQDVTLHVLLEKEIELERQKVVDIFNSMIDWIYVVDEEFNITFINKSLEKQVGIPSDKKCYHLLYSRENPCPFCKWENIKNEFTVRWELRREDGKTFDIISSPLKNPDGSLYSMNIMRDITRKKEVEEKYKHMSEETLRANQELTKTIEQLKKTQEQLIQSEKLAAIGKLVSGVAHELNNPLFSAMGYTELLAMDTVYDDGQKEKLDNILSSIKRARGIVKDLLKFARRENVEKELININEVIQQTLTLRKYELRLHNIDVECVLQEDIPTIQGNFVRLQQVLLNIVINAEHAITETDRNGLIKVRSYLDKAKKMVVMNVANNGSEIPPDIMNNIFDPFFTTKDVGKGTGLGLSTSYGIIRDHNGEIAVRSDKNWTVFTVSLPCSVEDMEDIEHEITEESEIKANGESILVVDDEPIIIKLLEDFFKRKGFTVISATSGNEALVKLKKNDVEFIITDIKMPEMDGKQFYDEVKSSKPKLLDRLIFITGDTLNNDTRAFLKKIRGNYLKKPFSFDEITEVLNIVARRNSQMNLF